MKQWLLISLIAVLLLVLAIIPSGEFVSAYNASSTTFFVRQGLFDISGRATSSNFGLLFGADQNALGRSNSSNFRIQSGVLPQLYQTSSPAYTQIHYHWRNDDGTEATATSGTGGQQDTATSSVSTSTIKRLRVEISNRGGSQTNFTTQQFRLEFASSSPGSCSSGSYTDVGAVGGAWDMATSSQLTEAGNTTNIATSTGGVTDDGPVFLAANGGQRESSSQTAALSLPGTNFVELEYAFRATASTTANQQFCFRVTNAGATSSFTYAIYPTMSLGGGGSNSPPTITNVKLNGNSTINLTAATTTTVYVSYTVTDNDGCSQVFPGGNVTTTVFRTDQGSSCAFSYQNCYIESTTTYSCDGNSANATTTFSIYYFADATDASSSASSTNWTAQVSARDSASGTGSATSTAVELNTLTAISLSSSTLSYGTVTAGGNTSSTNQTTEVFNAGNSSTTLQVSGNAMTGIGGSIPTSSQHYASSSFTFGGTEQLLSSVAATISGWSLSKEFVSNWVTANPLPGDLWGIETLLNRGFIYVLGGYEEGGPGETTTIKFASLSSTGTIGSWANTTPLPMLGIDFGAVQISNIFYIAGNSTTTVYYATTSASGGIGPWKTTSPIPNPVAVPAVQSYENYVYTFGGGNIGPKPWVYFTSTTASGTLNPWTTLTDLPYSIAYPRSAFHNGYIYIAGGFDDSNATRTVIYAPISATGSLGQWSYTTPLPSANYQHRLVAQNNMLYSFGGGSYGIGYTSTILVAPINSNGSLGQWWKVGDIPEGRASFGLIKDTKYGYILGGDYGGVAQPEIFQFSMQGSPLYWGLEVPPNTISGFDFNSTITYTAQFTQ